MGLVAERRLAALKRVYALCTVTPVPPPLASPPAGFPQQVAALKGCIDQITALMSEQDAGQRVTQHSTRERAQLRKTLREQNLLPLEHAARVIERTNTGITLHFRVPPSNAREAELVTAARAAATELAKPEFNTLFVDLAGPDFLDRLNAAIEAVDQSSGTNEAGRARRVNATTGVEKGLQEGKRIVRYILVLIRSACLTAARTDPVSAAQTVHNFETAAHVELSRSSSSRGATSTSTVGGSSGTTPAASTPLGGESTTAVTPAEDGTAPAGSVASTSSTVAPVAAAA